MNLTGLIVLAWICACSLPEVFGTLRGASKDHLDKLLSEYEIVRPFVTSYTGDFISHNLKHAKTLVNQHYARRQKRSLDDIQILNVDFSEGNVFKRPNKSIDVRNDMLFDDGNYTMDDVDITEDETTRYAVFRHQRLEASRSQQRRYMHFNVSAFGSNLQLRVESKQRLLAPGAKSIRFTSDGGRIEKDLNSDCLFFGKIPHHPLSKVAISNCDGLAGLIQTEDEEFFIEPLEEQHDSDTPQNHVIYRRSTLRHSENLGKRMDAERHKRDIDPNQAYDSLGNTVETVLKENQGGIIKSKRHAKRNDYNIEILLTADSEVVRFHGQDHVENYLLTLVNIVDEIYHDSSLGEHINIVLSRLYQLDEERSTTLIIDENASTSLKNVCKWAHTMHQTDPPAHGRAPDHAIFLTRRKFGPAGYAHVSGMCHPLRSCSLNHEDGFSSAFVVAHETGHVLGMEHDGEGNKCGDETSMGSIMAPLVQAAFHRYHWSRCSQQELSANLRNFACLRDDPHLPNWGPTPEYPGESYSMDDQCRFDFGQGYKRCTAFRNLDVCRTLWCSHDDNPLFCKTKKGPPIDGTECGENMWCFKSHCVWRSPHQEPEAIDGSWSPWSAFVECSRSCGTGVKYRSRMCNSPAPSNGGKDCVGKNVDYDLCSKQPCRVGTDFRADQCSFRNNEVIFKKRRHKWLPYEPLDADLKCDLFCVSKKTNDVVTMGDIVADGTLCSYDNPHEICIQGECVEIGCDKVIGSRTQEDECGICGGDGRQCRNVSGRVKKRTNRKLNNYIKLYKIPAGSRHVRIEEISSADNSNLLALKSRADKRYFLNAKTKRVREEETPRKIINSGTMWSYDSQNGVETITARGPLPSEVILMVLIQRRNVKMTVRYSYITHVTELPKPRDSYRFEIRRWSPCSATCGTGYKRAKYGCKGQTSRKWASKRNCQENPPRPQKVPCHVECRSSTRWKAGDWGPCSKTCGSDGFQNRAITCMEVNRQGVIQIANDASCEASQRPIARQVCHPHPCPPKWRTGRWSQCSATCGRGSQRRQVICRAPGIARAFNHAACTDARPSEIQSCVVAACQDEANTPSTATMTSPLSTSAELLVKNCIKDQSLFCTMETIAQYCAIPGYRKLCCKSCGEFLKRQGESGHTAFGRPSNVPLQFAVANVSGEISSQSGAGQLPSQNDADVLLHPSLSSLLPNVLNPVHTNDSLAPDGSMSGEDVIVEEVDGVDMSDVSNDDTENVGYYDETFTSDLMDNDDDLEEFILTLPPPNGDEAEDPTRASEEYDILTDSRNGSVTSAPSRRRRSVSHCYLVLTAWSECRVEECGSGSRYAKHDCWNNTAKSWTDIEHCPKAIPQKTACFVPCYSFSPRLVQHQRRYATPPSSSVCRQVKGRDVGPRVHSSKCVKARRQKLTFEKYSAPTEKFPSRTFPIRRRTKNSSIVYGKYDSDVGGS